MISSIRLVNAQTIPDFTFEFPKEGIVKFSGDNNDGKSILRKVLNHVIACDLHVRDNRLCLINDEQEYAQCIISKDTGEVLEVYMHREASKTYYEYRCPGSESIRRYLKDKNLQTIVYDNGFHYLAKREFSLNVHPANTPNLFETTSDICNKEAYDSATEDPRLNVAIENVENVIAELTEQKKEAETNMTIALSKINTSVIIDEEKEMSKVLKMQRLQRNIEAIYPLELVELKKPPTLDSINVFDVTNARKSLLEFKIPSKKVNSLLKQIRALKDIGRLTDISNSMREYNLNLQAYRDEMCPTCGRSVLDDSCKV